MYKYKQEDPFPERPETRQDCYNMPRPCPFVGCRYHLYLDIRRSGKIKVNSEHREPEDVDLALLGMPNTCALDIAEKNLGTGVTLEEIGGIYGLSRERIRQVQDRALRKMRKHRREFTGHNDLIGIDDPEHIPLFSTED